MAPPFFIAVQCSQCSTMQVKQQKKSGNKWTCAVCNQKHSVRKVFAQGSMAKDLRRFVQSFNMSRQFADNHVNLAPHDDCEILEEAADVISGNCDSRKQKRSDWTEYLNFKDATSAEVIAECDGDIKIMTELPKEMFKKPKLKDYPSRLAKQMVHAKLYSPAFSKGRATKNATSLDVEPRKALQDNSIIEDKISKLDSARFTAAKRASEWSSYITEDDSNSQLASEKGFSDEIDQNNFDAFTTSTRAQKVGDDIHPDFM